MQRYSRAAIVLHWTIAALLAFQISVGWALEDLGARGFALYQLHKSVGIAILLLTLIRVGVRWVKPRPPKLEHGWQGKLASIVHLGLYVFMLGAPLTGWALVSTARVKVPTLLFGILPLPHLPLPMGTHDLAESGHGLLAWFGLALFLLHVAGALRHHLLMRDGLIWRMVPGSSRILLVALPALILAGFALGRIILPQGGAMPSQRSAKAESRLLQTAPDNAPISEASSNDSADEPPANVVNAAEQDAALAPPLPTWAVQPGGRIGFSVGNGAETISGSFSKWSARIVMEPDHPESADINVTIDMGSASVGDAYQDGMLPGEEFFAVAIHPTATFAAKGATATGAHRYRASGTLTLKGVSRSQSIDFTLNGVDGRRTVSGSATIARMKFKVGDGASSGDLAPNVAVTFDFTAKRKG